MAAFDANDPGLEENRAYHLLVEGPVTLFWRMSLLDVTLTWLADHGYQVVRIHAGDWVSEMDMHRSVARALDFPDYYGHNLDALNDCLRDMAEGRAHHHAPEWTVDSAGLVVVFTGYDAYIVRQPRVAWVVLDIVAAQSRQALLFGHQILCLVQSDDSALRLEPVGATAVDWNEAEWRDDSRGRQ